LRLTALRKSLFSEASGTELLTRYSMSTIHFCSAILP